MNRLRTIGSRIRSLWQRRAVKRDIDEELSFHLDLRTAENLAVDSPNRWRKLRSLWKRREVKREIDEELRFHIEQRAAENLAVGMTPEDAAREARRRFGNLQSVREECREARGASLGEGTWRDVRFAFRMLRKNPGFTAVASFSEPQQEKHMNRFSPLRTVLPMLLGLLFMPASARPQPVQPAPAELVDGKGWKVINRSVTAIEKAGQPGIRFGDGTGIGIAWREGVTFTNGVIEFDVRGTNVAQHSFVGVAFHGADHQTYDAVYFRPFNFKADDAARRKRAVQYISHPTYTWSKLREERPGKYEQPVTPVPDPNGWFHVRVVVEHPKVSVFVNDAKEACLVVEQLSDRKQGRIGLWVDTGGGEFANLKIQ